MVLHYHGHWTWCIESIVRNTNGTNFEFMTAEFPRTHLSIKSRTCIKWSSISTTDRVWPQINNTVNWIECYPPIFIRLSMIFQFWIFAFSSVWFSIKFSEWKIKSSLARILANIRTNGTRSDAKCFKNRWNGDENVVIGQEKAHS